MVTGSPETPQLARTGLYDLHIEKGAQMVPFGGYSMPLLYGKVGQVASHNHVRNSVGLFDVGHMVQSFVEGPTATEFMEWLTPSGLSNLEPFSSTLSVFLNEKGGIIDDTIICKHASDRYYVVTNAACRDKDINWIQGRIAEWNKTHANHAPVTFKVLSDQGLVALQGPKAAEHLQKLTDYNLPSLVFGKSAYMKIAGVECHVARGGYTGEDGFEISIPGEHTVAITELISSDPVQLAGLAARDSLRLEAGMCLYGHDLDESTSPIEGNLNWVVAKERRKSGGFIGYEKVADHLNNGISRKRIGLIVEQAPAREGVKILHPETGTEIGFVTSGIPSPTTGKNIAMGYIQTKDNLHKKDSQVQVLVRGKPRPATVTLMPFVKTRYWRGIA
ncbi:uncharacterized protein EI90DRAFT_3144116 [Cantharellus anzutake]|uniref:uncharacterized protein n=1 Tax=Cantharellus anzutake TaxID=1750568 RepID=UPI0019066115|nr:uncharacterized protein EI90DRAFT_3144116 [Cantharellus anzutake]KAF8339899.1 hypothetical protein EI90DRAFT_3144116 [Cantharellus anzutake]